MRRDSNKTTKLLVMFEFAHRLGFYEHIGLLFYRRNKLYLDDSIFSLFVNVMMFNGKVYCLCMHNKVSNQMDTTKVVI